MDTQSYPVRILDEKGDIKETRMVQYNPLRLTRGQKLSLLEGTTVEGYAEYDMEKVQEAKPGQSLPKGALKSFDLIKWTTVVTKKKNECAKIVFGLGDVSLDNIVDEDFEPLFKFAEEKDLLGLNTQLEDAEKKIAEINSHILPTMNSKG